MKLADYEIREALSRKDWPAAVAALARHYDLDMPPEYRMDVMRSVSYVMAFHVKIYSSHWTCMVRRKRIPLLGTPALYHRTDSSRHLDPLAARPRPKAGRRRS